MNRMMSNIIRHILRENKFFLWQNRLPRLVPAHSKAPKSRHTLKVISVGTVGTLILLKNSIKFATSQSVSVTERVGRYNKVDERYVAVFKTMKPVSTMVVNFPFFHSTVLV